MRQQLHLPKHPSIDWCERLAGIARHDIGQPLHAAALSLQGVDVATGSSDGACAIAAARQGIEEARRHIDASLATFLSLLGGRTGRTSTASLASAGESAISILGALPAGVIVEVHPSDLHARIAPRVLSDMLAEAMLFLLAHTPCARVAVRARRAPAGSRKTLLIEALSDATGPRAEVVQRTLYSADAPIPRVDRYSTWSLIGLVAMLATIQAMGGKLFLRTLTKATHLRIELPDVLLGDSATNRSGPMRTSRALGTVLLVEDDELQRELLSRLLEAHGLKVNALSSGQELLDMLPTLEPLPSLVLLDMRLGAGHADDYLPACQRHYAPGSAPVVILTGSDKDMRFRDGRIPADVPVVLKPISDWNMKRLVERAAQGRAFLRTDFL